MSRSLLQSSPEPTPRPVRPGSAPPPRGAARPGATHRAQRPPITQASVPAAAPTSVAPAEVTAFLDHYGTAFAAADLVTVSRCYVPPVLVVGDGTAITFRSHDEIVEGFRDVVLGHREWGVASLRHEVLDLCDLQSPH